MNDVTENMYNVNVDVGIYNDEYISIVSLYDNGDKIRILYPIYIPLSADKCIYNTYFDCFINKCLLNCDVICNDYHNDDDNYFYDFIKNLKIHENIYQDNDPYHYSIDNINTLHKYSIYRYECNMS